MEDDFVGLAKELMRKADEKGIWWWISLWCPRIMSVVVVVVSLALFA